MKVALATRNAEPEIKYSISSLRLATKIKCSGEDPGEELINYSMIRRIRVPCGTDAKT